MSDKVNYKIYTDEQYNNAVKQLMANGWTGYFTYKILNLVIENNGDK